MWGHVDGWGWWMMFGGIWMVAFWGVVIGLIVWGINKASRGDTRHSDLDETPLEILRKRLAKGEISVDEFDELAKSLRQ